MVRPGLLPRPRPFRDARIVYVATEDTYAAPQYFEALKERGIVDARRVKVVILPSIVGQSAPNHLVDRLDRARERATAIADDESWIVFDVDHHRNQELSSVTAAASQKRYGLAGSNPCFELWLLLHETDDLSSIDTYKQDDGTAARRCEAELRRVLGRYNKTSIDTGRITTESVELAKKRARALDADPAARWPATVGTHVYRLVERLPPPQ